MRNANLSNLIVNTLFIDIYFLSLSNFLLIEYTFKIRSSFINHLYQLYQFIFSQNKPNNHFLKTIFLINWWLSHRLFYSKTRISPLNSRLASSAVGGLFKFEIFLLNFDLFAQVKVLMLDGIKVLFILTGASTFMGKKVHSFM